MNSDKEGNTTPKCKINVHTTDPKKWTEWTQLVQQQLEGKRAEFAHLLSCPGGLNEATTIITVALLKTARTIFNSDRNNSISIYKQALNDCQELHQLERLLKADRMKFATDITDTGAALKARRKEIKRLKDNVIKNTHQRAWEELNKKVSKDPSTIYRNLRGVGKKSKRNQDCPHAIAHNDRISCNPEEVKTGFKAAWEDIYKSKSAKKPLPEWLTNLPSRKFLPFLAAPTNSTEI